MDDIAIDLHRVILTCGRKTPKINAGAVDFPGKEGKNTNGLIYMTFTLQL